ncbi:hypothetical protein DPMN_024787 [Dreissena polymorpha]|uniref:Uncharacterized protein n=1 Tax=Dreissena polymorpha TaxID=45954 RepID=A0A9D4LS13_DREPO|nr:hypothetical protein DPMN_024787 [Dreissena polymorpha]
MLCVKGMCLPLGQHVYRKIVAEELQTTYTEKGNVYLFPRKVLSLPHLPHEHITPTLNTLASQAADVGGPVNRVMEYVGRTWVNGTMWTPEHWNILRETVRTNNDVEGWHRRMNSRAGWSDLGLYVIVPFLRAEAQTVSLQVLLVFENLLTATLRKRYKDEHDRLFYAFDAYELGTGKEGPRYLGRRCIIGRAVN